MYWNGESRPARRIFRSGASSARGTPRQCRVTHSNIRDEFFLLLDSQDNIRPMCSMVARLGRAVGSVLPSAKRCQTRKLTRKRMPIDDGVGQVKQRLKLYSTSKAI